MDIDLSIIVAMTQERVIGNNGKLPWQKLPSDLARFKQITTEAGVVVMGRKTYESILRRNARPLPDRKHIVLTRRYVRSNHDLVQFVDSIQKALEKVAEHGGRACVIGGGEIFNLFLPMQHVKRLCLTTVYAPELCGDVYFPAITSMEWKSIRSSGRRKWNPNDEYETLFETYSR
ncbi:MAG: dihydrofolate reductase [Candidatus Paceibacterota bacterium]|jgi:dihydrofolate reductase